MSPNVFIWLIAAATTFAIIVRPRGIAEAVWAILGAVLLVVFGLLPLRSAWAGVTRGLDVYLFLAGMMLLAELARQEGLFDWLAIRAARLANGSSSRLFTLIYGVGTLVTIFLSNDATAVVLTPAVAAVTRAARTKNPLPYLFVCAFIANAASFVLPISNPANLVIYDSHMPPLLTWLARYALPSALSIAVTFAVLRFTHRRDLNEPLGPAADAGKLSGSARATAIGIAFAAVVLLVSSALNIELGLPTFLAGALTALFVLRESRFTLRETLQSISWGVLPLIAGLFVLVEALEQTGVTKDLARELETLAHRSVALGAWATGLAFGFGCNAVNNLPAGLVAGRVVQLAHVAEPVRAATLIGIDLGPNLSVTGSLATILWLAALRREGVEVSAWTFLKLGFLVMTPALVLAIASLLLFQ